MHGFCCPGTGPGTDHAVTNYAYAYPSGMHYSFLRVAEALLRLVGWPKLVMLLLLLLQLRSAPDDCEVHCLCRALALLIG